MLESLQHEIWNFLYKYFWEPMFTRSGYNPVNTLVYALLLGFGAIYTYRYILKPLRIKIDRTLFMAVTLMVVFGSTVRALVDGGILPQNPLILTPGIFFTTFFVMLPAIVLDAKLKTYPKLTFGWGALLALGANYLLVTHAKSWEPYELTLIHTFVSWIPALLIYRYRPFDRLYLYAVLAHLYDMGSTVVAIHFYGYREVHWLENILVQHFGAYFYYPWITFILVVVYYGLQKLVPDEEERRLWYLMVYVLGLGPAIRDPAQLVLQIGG
ncbi:hypothetical protein CL1_1692 [Thermococcus cleftensis]|uniref:Uncharacterized protein n=1 Tax=Thermococcus cleftensis (strain DSM 27260 / KACC 17922 / CL1) TaxID=163003 RepID=I3ZW05_THECF|nr:DUF63 family protein [Thermococcus cleftensis]AFL95889.1 hypothetical protein CL1_1692 [Thermococcus cleftensis]